MFPRARIASFRVVVASLLAACGNDARVSSNRDALIGSAPAASPVSSAADMSAERRGGAELALASSPAQTVDPAAGAAAAVLPPSMIIRNGSASIQVDSLELAVAAVQKLAATFGGYVGNTSLSAGDFQVRSATLELKIPAARFDAALAGLEPIGKVESVSSTAEDVGEEFVDVTARVANARRLEERMINLLATRTGKLEEVLAVERELSRVREEIERYEGRLRYLKSRVAISTLSVTVHERAPLVSATPGENILVDAFRNAWRNFVRFIAGFIASLGIVVPLLAIVALIVVAWRRIRRRTP